VRRAADLDYRPSHARSGAVTFTVNGRPVMARAGSGARFTLAAPAGAPVEVKPGAARDRFGNSNRNDLTFIAG
jgi:hypothetical protein